MKPSLTLYCENDLGVHLHSLWDDRTLCGGAMEGYPEEGGDAMEGYPEEGGDILINATKATAKRTVTCPECSRVILMCRGVRVK